ncbi:hypothetical protein BC628DRAFT_469577 [Trametes gibbosa]|nr:hypothetical protein BC628DRAFT_469577 [Trametes gibbosa]
MKQFTEGLLQRCPRLAEIFVEIVGLPLFSILVPLCGLAGTLPLQNFSVSVKNSTLNLPALKNLTHLSVLKSLKVAGICHVTRNSPLHFLRLDALQELVVTWHVLGSIPAVLTSTSLRSLSIKDIASVPCESGGQSMLRNICTKLTKAFPALEDLTLSLRQPEVSFGGRPRRSGRYHCAEAADVLEPLLDHVSLRVVNLSTSRIFLTLSDDDVDRFARASPSLRRLYMTVNGCLGPSRAFYREPETVSERCARLYSVGLPALVSLARHCPDLEVLHLEFVHIRGEDVARLPAEPPCHGLHNLEITSGCVARGAYQLIRDRIFPNIDMPR